VLAGDQEIRSLTKVDEKGSGAISALVLTIAQRELARPAAGSMKRRTSTVERRQKVKGRKTEE
jgi:hypothetical protein